MLKLTELKRSWLSFCGFLVFGQFFADFIVNGAVLCVKLADIFIPPCIIVKEFPKSVWKVSRKIQINLIFECKIYK